MVISQICDRLDQEAANYGKKKWDRSAFNRKTLDLVGAIAPAFASQVGCRYGKCTHAGGNRVAVYSGGGNLPDGGRGYLFDQCWLTFRDDQSDEDGFLARCNVAVEIECSLNAEDIFYDFQKLLVASADNKIMIFWARTVGEGERLVSDLKRQVSLFHEGPSHSEQYLLSFFCMEDDKFHHGVVGSGFSRNAIGAADG